MLTVHRNFTIKQALALEFARFDVHMLQIVSSISLRKNWTNIKDSKDIWMKRLVNIKQGLDCAVKG